MTFIATSATRKKAFGRHSGVLYHEESVKEVKELSMNEVFLSIICKIEGIDFNIITVYLRDNNWEARVDMLTEHIKDLLESQGNTLLVLRGDFNARIRFGNQLDILGSSVRWARGRNPTGRSGTFP